MGWILPSTDVYGHTYCFETSNCCTAAYSSSKLHSESPKIQLMELFCVCDIPGSIMIMLWKHNPSQLIRAAADARMTSQFAFVSTPSFLTISPLCQLTSRQLNHSRRICPCPLWLRSLTPYRPETHVASIVSLAAALVAGSRRSARSRLDASCTKQQAEQKRRLSRIGNNVLRMQHNPPFVQTQNEI